MSRFTPSHKIDPQVEQEDREKLLKDFALVTKEEVGNRKKRFKYPYYDFLKFSGPVATAEVQGIYTPRIVQFKAIRGEGQLLGWAYNGYCPWQGFVFQYITQSHAINLRKNKAMLIVR